MCVCDCLLSSDSSLILFVSLAGSNSDYRILIKVSIFGTTVSLIVSHEEG